MRRPLLALALLVLLASAAQAFDGDRRGFTLSAGVGWSPYSEHSQAHHDEKFIEEGNGVAVSLEIGWGWSEHDILTFGGNVATFTSDFFGGRHANQGFAGFGWYHYFGRPGSSLFSMVGVGSYAFGVEDDYEQPEAVLDQEEGDWVYQATTPRRRGPGGVLGLGWEFAEHWQAGTFLSAGRTTAYDVDIDHVHWSFLVQWVAF